MAEKGLILFHSTLSKLDICGTEAVYFLGIKQKMFDIINFDPKTYLITRRNYTHL